jgi:outer membrane protein OmpA-like peptidoglycan-associated protein
MSHVASTQPDLLGLVSRQITPDVIRSAASQLGEDRGRTASAISTSVPSVLTALSDVASTDTGAAHLREVIDEKRRPPGERMADTAALFPSTAAATGDHAATFIDDELGTKATTLSDAVARTSGIRRDSAHKLMGGVTAVAMAAIARNTSGLGSGALQTMFHDQRGEWVKRLPSPVASLFNGHAVETTTTTTGRRVYEERVTGPAIRRVEGPRRGWLIPLILVALALLAIPLIRGLRRPAVAPPAPPQVTQTAPPTPAPQAPAPEQQAAPPPAETAPAPAPTPPAEEATPPPATTEAAPGDTQALEAFLAGGAGQTPKTFAPTPLNFAFGSTKLTPESTGTLDEVAGALKDHPGSTIRVESFTDNIGSPESNLKLSMARSESVKKGLVQRGVPEENIETAGLGQDQPIAPNDTAEGRAQNRRTDIVVTGR